MHVSIDKNTDKFFIALGKENSHSFIMFGVYDQNRVSHLLCRVGKDIDEVMPPNTNKYMVMADRLRNAFFSKLKSRLKNERTQRTAAESPSISYQAYDSTYEQYLEFIQLLEALQTEKNQFLCYKPVQEDGTRIQFVKTSTPICACRTELGSLKRQIEEYTIGNTCRHTAIKLVEEVQKTPISPMVSSSFFRELPYRTKLVYGKPSAEIPFYVLPASPAVFHTLTAEQKRTVEKVYQRMEHLVLLEPELPQTVEKFNSLKSMYIQITGAQTPLTLDELIHTIQSWKDQNKSTLSTLRHTYFWDAFFTRESATMKMIADIEQDLLQVKRK